MQDLIIHWPRRVGRAHMQALLGDLSEATQALVDQRLRRACWIVAQGLSAIEAAHIPLNFDPAQEGNNRE